MENSTKKILLIEDDDFIRDLYKRQFELANLTTDAFGNGIDGLAALSQNIYSLILLDIMLPGMNGLQILKKIKGDEKTKNIPVVLLTNLGQNSVIQEGLALGAKEHIIKASYTPDQVVEIVKKLMNS